MKISTSIYILFVVNLFSLAQPIRQNILKADYIHKEYSNLDFPASQEYANIYFEKMRTLLLYGEGNINVVHIGGSHIQADVYSNQMRQLLGNYAPNQFGSRGLIFPFKIAKTNGPYDYRVTYNGEWNRVRNVSSTLDTPLGVAGISVYTSDTTANLQIAFRKEEQINHKFNRIKVLHELDSVSFQIKWLGTDSVHIEPNYEQGYTLLSFDVEIDSISIGFEQTDSLQQRFILYGLYLENDKPGFIYNSIGVNGASTESYLKCELFESQMQILNPDIVFFGIGINDAHGGNFTKSSFITHYDSIIAQIHRVNPNTLFVFLSNNDSYGYNKKLNTNGVIVQEAMYELAKKHNGAIWDLFAIMGGLKSVNIWMANGLMKKDRIHFTNDGYRLIGNMIFNAIMDGFETYIMDNSKTK